MTTFAWNVPQFVVTMSAAEYAAYVEQGTIPKRLEKVHAAELAARRAKAAK